MKPVVLTTQGASPPALEQLTASIADAINSLLDNENRRREMGRNGRLAAENELNWNLEARKLLAVYDPVRQ